MSAKLRRELKELTTALDRLNPPRQHSIIIPFGRTAEEAIADYEAAGNVIDDRDLVVTIQSFTSDPDIPAWMQ